MDLAWWHIGGVPGDDDAVQLGVEDVIAGVVGETRRFRLERHLQDFLWANWDDIPLSEEWELYHEPGDPDLGYEYPCGIGCIDILARHKTRPDWLVVELKRGQTSDATVGQVLRYMGWIKNHLAEVGEQVHGLIIAHQVDDSLRYALSNLQTVDLQRYEVKFQLHPVPRLGEELM